MSAKHSQRQIVKEFPNASTIRRPYLATPLRILYQDTELQTYTVKGAVYGTVGHLGCTT